MKTKRCSRCKINKLPSEFWKDRRSKDGLQSLCKKCSNKANSYATRSARAKKDQKPKRCSRCGQTKEPTEFYVNSANSDGLQSYCKPCFREYTDSKVSPEKKAQYIRTWGLKRFGLTVEDYDRMLVDQGGGCAICGIESCHTGKRLGVDHDAESGRVRGLLCRRCNQAIGEFDHDPALLRAAADYLERATIAA